MNYVWLKPIVMMFPEQVHLVGQQCLAHRAHVIIYEEDNSTSPTGAIGAVLDGCDLVFR